MQKIFVVVSNGTAEVMQDTVPQGFQVEVIDFDLIRAGDSFPSPEAFQYCQNNQMFKERRKKNLPQNENRRQKDLEVTEGKHD